MYRQELITLPEALRNASNRESLAMALRGISSSKSVTEPTGAHRPGMHPKPQPPVDLHANDALPPERPAGAPASGGMRRDPNHR